MLCLDLPETEKRCSLCMHSCIILEGCIAIVEQHVFLTKLLFLHSCLGVHASTQRMYFLIYNC
uniref:Uncharacterized protein n=1 Tax=Arundo donax TaxID=35708 RepID=A0A0A9ESN5_ARUDO